MAGFLAGDARGAKGGNYSQIKGLCHGSLGGDASALQMVIIVLLCGNIIIDAPMTDADATSPAVLGP